jgi:hypothetical protein
MNNVWARYWAHWTNVYQKKADEARKLAEKYSNGSRLPSIKKPPTKFDGPCDDDDIQW